MTTVEMFWPAMVIAIASIGWLLCLASLGLGDRHVYCHRCGRRTKMVD